MKKGIVALGLFIISHHAAAQTASTLRIPQFSNAKTTVWKTIIYPGASQQLTMHRHDNERVLVALSDGVLTITNDKGHTHYLTLKKNQAYFLPKDISNEYHTDQNLTSHPITVMVIELNNSN